jgi:hypothetical protein
MLNSHSCYYTIINHQFHFLPLKETKAYKLHNLEPEAIHPFISKQKIEFSILEHKIQLQYLQCIYVCSFFEKQLKLSLK